MYLHNQYIYITRNNHLHSVYIKDKRYKIYWTINQPNNLLYSSKKCIRKKKGNVIKFSAVISDFY